MKKLELFSASVEETKDIGRRIASLAKPGDVVLLKGNLGSGKTTLVQGAGDGLGVNERVISPTFNILKCYFRGRMPMYHIDGYRLEDQNLDIGLEEVLYGNGLSFVEWPEFLEDILPEERLEIAYEKLEGESRKLILEAKGERVEALLEGLSK